MTRNDIHDKLQPYIGNITVPRYKGPGEHSVKDLENLVALLLEKQHRLNISNGTAVEIIYDIHQRKENLPNDMELGKSVREYINNLYI